VKLVRAIKDYAVLAGVRRRRALALEEALRAAESRLIDARTDQARAEAELGARQATLADYVGQLSLRTAPRARVRLDDLQGARGHRERLASRCDEARMTLDAARDAVGAAERGCAQARRDIALNENRIRSLDAERAGLQRLIARDLEEREDDERTDALGRRSGTPA
jgi:chromosome segregation ATPase